MRVLVTLSVFNDKIKYRIRGSRLFCSMMKCEIPRTRTISKNDSIWNNVFKSPLEKKQFINNGKSISVISDLSNFGYDKCDSSSIREVKKSKIKLSRVGDSLKFVGGNNRYRINLSFDYSLAEKSLSEKNCWRIVCFDELENQEYVQAGYLDIILDDYKQIVQNFSEEEYSEINNILGNKFHQRNMHE
jgi:hypothetical protein